MEKYLISLRYDTYDKDTIECIEDFIAQQDDVIREVDGTFTVDNVVILITLSQKIYKTYGDYVTFIKSYKYIDTINLSKSNVCL